MDRMWIDVTRDHERHVVGDVEAAKELDEIALVEPAHAVRTPDHGAAIRMRDERGRE